MLKHRSCGGGSRQLLAKLNITEVCISSSCVRVQDTVRDLGVVIDSQLTLSVHVAAVCRSGYFQLRQLRPAVRSLSDDASRALVQAFISCRLDYCNSVLFGISDGLLGRLQSVQNAAARLITGARRCDHITPALRQLHWLPVRQRVAFKIATLVYRSLSADAPGYLVDDCCLVADAGERRLRSADGRICVVRRTHSSFGDRAFAAAGPRLWNSLPLLLRQPDLPYSTFRRLLKTFLFGQL